jgi:flavorubredoxin
MVSYDDYDKVLFSADGFGKFGALDYEEPWDDEARRYFIGIVGKYGAPVQNLLKVASTLDIKIICSLHGPVLNSNLAHYLDLYDKWSSYTPEVKGTLIVCASVYGNTLNACTKLKNSLESKNEKVELLDLTTCDLAYAIAAAFKYDKLVIASITYNGDIFPVVKQFINGLIERNYQKRSVAFIENGSWAPCANKVMASYFEKSKDIKFMELSIELLNN